METQQNKPKKKSRGKRYSQQERAEILNFVDQHNAENGGRGGAAAASRKYKVSQLTIGNWIKKSAGGASSSKKASSKSIANKDIKGILKQIESVHKKMAKAEDQLQELRKEYASLKSQL